MGWERAIRLERVKGIEPSSVAWEATALPLSYTRPMALRTWDAPLGTSCPSGLGWLVALLAIGHHADVSTLSGRGDRFIPYPWPLQPRHSLFPHSCSRYTIVRPCGRPCWRSTANSITGFPRSVHATELFGFHLSAGGPMSACPHQAGGQPTSSLFGLSLSIAFGSVSLTTFIGDSLSLTLQTQPSAYPGAIPGVTPVPSRGSTSREGATLTERFVPGSYPPRTAPWLPVAENRVD